MKLSTVLFIGLFSFGVTQITNAQTQLNNSGFEDWENVGSATEEPIDWNAFKTASGALANFASQQIKRSTIMRPGSSGLYSSLIWSKEIMGVTANGNLTTGQINMGNMTPSHQDNYNITHTGNPAFSEALGASPDSLVFWAKFKPAAAGTDSARMRAVIHDNYDYRDPSTSDANAASHLVGDATIHFASTNGQWKRFSAPVNYSGPASSPDYILITFTTNKTPGGGSGGDSLYIDDLSLTYPSGAGITNIDASENFLVYTDDNDMIIDLSFEKLLTSKIAVYNISGQIVYKTQITAQNVQHYIGLNQFKSGIYIVTITTDDGRKFNQKVPIK